MILNIILKLIQSHGQISIKAQLNLNNCIKINKNLPKKRGLTIETMKSFNLGLKLLAKFIAGKITVSPTSIASCIRAKKFVKIPLTKLLALYSNFVNIMFTLI